MSITSFSFPTAILFGSGALAELPARLQRLGIHHPLVVTDAGLVPTNAFGALRHVLGPPGQRTQWFLYSEVHPNPIETDVLGAALAFRENQCDAVIAFGGGSSLDVGKAARLLAKRPGLKLADFDFSADWTDLPPLIAIPTTAGTGSEVGRSSVITLAATNRKKVIFHPELLAALVILDPELTRDLPPKLTAATGADALTHCIESYTCPVFHPMCDGIALEGIGLIVDALPRAYQDGHDLEARGKMLMAAAMGAVSFQKDLGATHSLAHPLSTICGLHHGLANALCLTAVMNWNAERRPGLYRRVGIACGLDVVKCPGPEADRQTLRFMGGLLASLGLGAKLSELGVKESQIEALTAQAFADPCHHTNAVPMTADDLRKLYLSVL
jgi:4-hydroxybutyrate dehydrogenase